MSRVAHIGWPVFAALALAAALAIIITRLEVTGDVTAFLPDADDDERVDISRALARSGLGKGMVIIVSGPTDTVAAATRTLADKLSTAGDLEWVQTGIGPRSGESLREIFFPSRMAFLAESGEALAKRLSDDGLAEAAARLKEVLISPLGAAIRRDVGSDPLLAFQHIVERLSRARPKTLEVEAGAFITSADEKRGVIFLATKASPFKAAAQRRVLETIKREARALGDQFDVEMTGVNVLAVDGEQSTRADVKRISIASLIGTALLFLLCFRRLRYMLVLAVPIGFGIAGGLAMSLVAFGAVHGMTLAFGATLIGVSVDYVVHFLAHHTLEEGSPQSSLKSVWPGVALGGLTTIVGFVGMGLTSTEGMRQIAVFGATGIGFALLATYAVLPRIVGSRAKNAGLGSVRLWARRWLVSLRAHRKLVALVAVILAGGAALTLPRLHWNDNPRGLATVNRDLLDSDQRIRAAIATADAGRFVVSRGDSWEQALIANDAVAKTLEEAIVAGELTDFRSLHSLLWSTALQKQNLDAVWGDDELANRLPTAFAAAGFRPEAFGELAAHLAGPPPPVVQPEAVVESPLLPLVRGFFVAGDDGVLVLTQLTGVRDAAGIERRLEQIPGASYFDQTEFLEASYGGFRRRVLEVVAIGLIAVFVLVLLRYRRWRPAMAAFVPAVVAAAGALTIVGLAGVTLNLLHVLGLMLVLSIGVDYGIFVVEAWRKSDDVSVALLGTAVSCATTILGFGLLAMSENPALRALGSITAVGCVLSVAFAPAAVALLGERR